MGNERIEMLSPAAALAIADGLGLHEAVGKLNVFRTLFHRPKAAKAIADLLLSLLMDAALAPRLRELVILRIGWATGCAYEWTQHWHVAQEVFGCDREELLAVRDWNTALCFDERDRAVLAVTDELLETRDLSDESWARCHAALGRDASIDLVAAVGTWTLISTVARGLRVPLEDGVAAWPPDGRPSPAAHDGAPGPT